MNTTENVAFETKFKNVFTSSQNHVPFFKYLIFPIF